MQPAGTRERLRMRGDGNAAAPIVLHGFGALLVRVVGD
jgi:hypothetical protein